MDQLQEFEYCIASNPSWGICHTALKCINFSMLDPFFVSTCLDRIFVSKLLVDVSAKLVSFIIHDSFIRHNLLTITITLLLDWVVETCC